VNARWARRGLHAKASKRSEMTAPTPVGRLSGWGRRRVAAASHIGREVSASVLAFAWREAQLQSISRRALLLRRAGLTHRRTRLVPRLGQRVDRLRTSRRARHSADPVCWPDRVGRRGFDRVLIGRGHPPGRVRGRRMKLVSWSGSLRCPGPRR